ncbi:aldehyde dehydrogenase family 16 member A1 isoform X2 [Caretta caretta]|uniref:aldehyde dehydrogenase family 16 member A1 isoform X2 n=1 Tax=Caretta caretta TaxID=8467 RepID=UPI00209432D0|nr:aldehyde dehydrogenase family 16 member A1 isoform X2 [Caretta caretta]
MAGAAGGRPSVWDIYSSMEYGPAPEGAGPAQAWLETHGRSFGHFVAGKWWKPEGRETASDTNPATGELLATTLQGEPEDVEAAVQAATKAFEAWSRLPCHARARHLHNMARTIQKHQRLLALLESLDTGKPIGEVRDRDAPLVVRHFYHHAGWAQLMGTEMGGWKPLGVVAAVVTWNSPLLPLAWKICPALAMGNTMVLLPPPRARLSALLLAELGAQAGLPPGVLNVLTGEGALAGGLAAHPGVDAVAVAGSVEVGRSLRRATAGGGPRLSLQLGGDTLAIVFDSADLDGAAVGLSDAVSCQRGLAPGPGALLLVQEAVAGALLQRLKMRLGQLRVGDPLDKAMDGGALADEAQRGAIETYVEEARAEGAEILGPVLVVLPFRTAKEAVALGNHRPSGLAASVWTENLPLAMEVAQSLQVGTVWINGQNFFDAAAGVGGTKESGNGRDGGKEGLYEYVRPSWQSRPRPGPTELDYKTFAASYGADPPSVPGHSGVACPELEENMPRVDRTYKLYYGGAQKRPEGMASLPVLDPAGNVLAYVADGSAKDIRNAVEAAHKAAPGWGKRAAHTRAQVLYYVAENLELRREEVASRLGALTGAPPEEARREVDLGLERLFHWAACCDKSGGVMQETPLHGTTLRLCQPLGVVGVACPDEHPLLSFLSLLAPAVARGNAVVVVPSPRYPLPALDLCQIFDTSDVPGGVVNIVTGNRDHLSRTLVQHQDVQAMWYFGSPQGSQFVEWASAGNLKRTWVSHGAPRRWEDPAQGAGEEFLYQATQCKNIWIPMGEIFAN